MRMDACLCAWPCAHEFVCVCLRVCAFVKLACFCARLLLFLFVWLAVCWRRCVCGRLLCDCWFGGVNLVVCLIVWLVACLCVCAFASWFDFVVGCLCACVGLLVFLSVRLSFLACVVVCLSRRVAVCLCLCVHLRGCLFVW